MGLSPDDVDAKDQKSGRRLKGERKFREGARRLNFYKTKRSDRSKNNEGRLSTPDDIEKAEGESDIFRNTLKEKREDESEDEIPKTMYPAENSEDEVPKTGNVNEDSGDYVPAVSLKGEESADELADTPDEESEDIAMDVDEDEPEVPDELPNENEYSKTSAPTFMPVATETTRPPVPMPTLATVAPSANTDAPTFEPTVTTESPTVKSTDVESFDEFKPTPNPTSFLFEMPSGSYDEPQKTQMPKKKTYAPAYYKPLPTPRPTNAAPTPKPTRRPTNLTPYPTMEPTVSTKPSISPSISPQPSASPTRPETEPPTSKPSTAPTLEPTEPPTAADTFDRSVCVSDDNGSYGTVVAPVTSEITFRYQVEATSTYTVDQLNNEALPQTEKGISDVLVPRLFFPDGECDDEVVAEARSNVVASLTLEEAEDAIERESAQKWALGVEKKKQRGGRTSGWETPPGHRFLQEEEDRLFGLSAAPADIVIRGRLQNACPGAVGGTGPDGQPLICWVIEGAVTLFGSGDLSWASATIQAALDAAMNSGEFDNGAVNPNVIYVRHIAPDIVLEAPVDEARGPPEDDDEGTPVWAWVLIGLGVGGLLIVLTYLIVKRRQQQQDFENQRNETEFLAPGSAAGNDAVPG